MALKQELRDLGLKDADVYSIHGNVLVDNRTNGGVLILGVPESGKSTLSREILT